MTELDYTRLFDTTDRILWIQRDHLLYNITDQHDTLIFYTPSLDTAERFMRAYVAKNPGATLDTDALEIARGALLHRETLARALTRLGGGPEGGPVAAASPAAASPSRRPLGSEPASPPDDFSRAVLANVIPIRRDVA